MSGLFEQYDNLLPSEFEEKTDESLQWFRKNLRNIRVKQEDILRSQGDTALPSDMRTGEMFMYMYDAKYKDVLPYYDKFPVMILIEKSFKGCIGLNLHYIPPRFRARFLEELYKLSNDDGLEEGAKFNITYELLMKISELKYGKPCVKKYLWTHIESRIIRILPEHWDVVSMLPLQQFNINANTVYADSKGKF